MYLWLYEKLYKRRNTFDYYKQYVSNETLSKTEIDIVRFNKLKKLLIHCYEFVPYYKKIWNSINIDPNNFSSFDDIQKLPILTKDEVRKNYSELISKKHIGNVIKSTGGSSGSPLKFELDLESDERRRAVMWRGYRWGGYRIGEKALYLWGTDADKKSFSVNLKENLYHYIYNRKMLNSFNMNSENMHVYWDEFNKYRPDVVVSYVTPLVLLANWIKDNKKEVFSPRRILTGAEALNDYQRDLLNEVFCCRIVNTYGCREVMLIASECDQCGKMHCNDDHLYLETINKDGVVNTGEAGDLLITDLHNFGFPLIRYKNGDRVSLIEAEIDCHIKFSTISRIHGRHLEHVVTPTGNLVPGEFFPHLLKDVAGLIKYRIIQTTANDLVIQYVPAAGFNEARWKWSIDQIKQKVGSDMLVAEVRLEEIPLTMSGKHLVCVNQWLAERAIA